MAAPHRPESRSGWSDFWKMPVLVFLGLFVSAILALALFRQTRTTLIWPCNSLLTACLLVAPRKRWNAVLCAGFLGLLFACLLVDQFLVWNLFMSVVDVVEALLAAWLLKKPDDTRVDLTARKTFLRFLFCAVLLAPLVTTALAKLTVSLLPHFAITDSLQFYLPDMLGMATVLPITLAIIENPPSQWLHRKEFAALFTLLIAITTGMFLQEKIPFLFVIYPLLQILCIRLGLGAATIGVFAVGTIGGIATAKGHGPLMVLALPPAGKIIYLQVFLALGLLIIYTAWIVLAERDRIANELRKSSSLYRLITEHSRDIIALANLETHRLFVSPAVRDLLGYEPDELLHQPLTNLTHPDDLNEYRELLESLRNGVDGRYLTYRLRKKSGDYTWVEGNIRLYRDDGGFPIGFVNIIRDISLRKKNEDELKQAYRSVEALAVADALTGIANRRRFDEAMAIEWKRAMRDNKPLSLLLLDVDFFKRYNDHYGHVQGDSCLKQIADAALDVISRPADVVARFGGEEFAIILPSTPTEGAQKLAELVRLSISQRAIPHAGNPFQVVTVSIGCATIAPQRGMHSLKLIELADKALYAAKSKGRNCTITAEATMELPGSADS